MSTKEENIPHVFIKPLERTATGMKIQLNYGFVIESEEEPVHGRIACHIEGFDIYYSATSQEDILPRGTALLKMWFSNYLDFGEKRLKRFSLALNRLGFRAKENEAVMSSLLRSKVVKADFTNKKPLEPVFNNSRFINYEQELAVAI